MKKTLAILTFVLTIALGVGCQSVTPPQPYVAADRKTKTAATHYLDKTKVDHPDLAQGIDDLLESWELRVKNAEGGVWPQ
jgi:hypothetical protein